MHFLQLRLHAGAQYEIRQYALGLLHLALPHFPLSLEAWQNVYGKELDLTTDTFTQEFTQAIEK
jgi:thymidylate synthase ThyX